MYLCGCEWLYDAYFGYFWGLITGCKAVATGQVVPL